MSMKSISAILTIGILLSLTLACRADNADQSVVRQKIKAGALVVDVRTPAEVAAGAYQGAINIPLDQVEKRLSDFGDRKHPIVVYDPDSYGVGDMLEIQHKVSGRHNRVRFKASPTLPT
jgi:hypothetical protein